MLSWYSRYKQSVEHAVELQFPQAIYRKGFPDKVATGNLDSMRSANRWQMQSPVKAFRVQHAVATYVQPKWDALGMYIAASSLQTILWGYTATTSNLGSMLWDYTAATSNLQTTLSGYSCHKQSTDYALGIYSCYKQSTEHAFGIQLLEAVYGLCFGDIQLGDIQLL